MANAKVGQTLVLPWALFDSKPLLKIEIFSLSWNRGEKEEEGWEEEMEREKKEEEWQYVGGIGGQGI